MNVSKKSACIYEILLRVEKKEIKEIWEKNDIGGKSKYIYLY